jgi:hypothetical protein
MPGAGALHFIGQFELNSPVLVGFGSCWIVGADGVGRDCILMEIQSDCELATS